MEAEQEVHCHRDHDRHQCLGSSDPAALGQEEVAHPHLFIDPDHVVPAELGAVDLTRNRHSNTMV